MNVPASTPCNRIPVEVRAVEHPRRARAHYNARIPDPKKRWLEDPGGPGTQIVKEVNACPACSCYGAAMPEADKKPFAKQATEKLFAALNRADEIGGEVRDYLQERVAHDPRYVAARKKLAGLLGRNFESRAEVADKAAKVEAKKAAVAAPTPVKTASKGFGDPAIKAQIYGKKSCPWSGRAITLLEKHKVDFDFVDLEEPEHEAKAVPLANETKQHTVPYVYLRGHFVGGFNALAEVERLGQLEVALMSAEERASAPAHLKSVEIVPRPNTDEVAPADATPGE